MRDSVQVALLDLDIGVYQQRPRSQPGLTKVLYTAKKRYNVEAITKSRCQHISRNKKKEQQQEVRKTVKLANLLHSKLKKIDLEGISIIH